MTSKRALIWTLTAALLAIVACEYSGLDLLIQDCFFNFQTGKWLVDQNAPVPRFFFYNFPKILLFIYGVTLVFMATAAPRFRRTWFLPKRTALYLLCCLAVIPTMIGIGKSVSWVYCPNEISRYGGPSHYRRVFDRIPEDTLFTARGRCFPAAHPSGGFALISLYFAARTRAQKLRVLVLPLLLGGTMSLYQMLKGAHYLSHTAVTLIVAWGISVMLANAFGLRRQTEV